MVLGEPCERVIQHSSKRVSGLRDGTQIVRFGGGAVPSVPPSAICGFLFFETGFLCVTALAVREVNS